MKIRKINRQNKDFIISLPSDMTTQFNVRWFKTSPNAHRNWTGS